MYLIKRYISFLLLCIIALPSLISMVSSSYIQWIKHEMKERLEISNLQTITLNNHDFSWYEKEHEIIINGELFDVKAYSSKENQTTFQGIFDKEESNMSALAEEIVSNRSENKHLVQIGGYFQLLQYIHQTEECELKLGCLKSVFHFYNDSLQIYPILSTPTPPPDSSLS